MLSDYDDSAPVEVGDFGISAVVAAITAAIAFASAMAEKRRAYLASLSPEARALEIERSKQRWKWFVNLFRKKEERKRRQREFDARIKHLQDRSAPIRGAMRHVLVGGVRPTLGSMPLDEAQLMLQGLYYRDILQLQHGAPPISQGIASGEIRYDVRDPGEFWQSIGELWASKRGDCEDIASAIAAEWTLEGRPARPVIYRSGPGKAHAVVKDMTTGQLFDPSITAGMGR